MIVPNKYISFDESVLGKLIPILKSAKSSNIQSLYSETEKHFDGPDQFLYALDVLYILGKVDVQMSSGKIFYVD